MLTPGFAPCEQYSSKSEQGTFTDAVSYTHLISGGVGQVYMPDVVGLSKEKAEQELKDLGLFVDVYKRQGCVRHDHHTSPQLRG